MKFYNKETGEICFTIRGVLRAAYADWRYYDTKPWGWRIWREA